MVRTDPAEPHWWIVGETEEEPVDVTEFGGGDQQAGIVEGDEAGVEEGVVLGGEQQTVEDIEAFGVGGAVGPWFGVACAEEFREMKAGEGAGTAPVVHERLAEEVLADALLGEPQRLGGSEWLGFDFDNFRGVLLGRVVWQGHRQLGGAAEESCQFSLAGGLVAAVKPEVGIRAIQFRYRRAERKIDLPGPAAWRSRNHRLRLMAGREQDHAFRRLSRSFSQPLA